jgi:putative redox protein
VSEFTDAHKAAHTAEFRVHTPQVVHTVWRKDQEFESGKPGVPPMLIDSHGKAASGPVETLLAAFATCAATDVVEILAKRRTPLEKLEVESFGTRAESTPRRLVHVLMKFTITGKGIERHHAERAIELAVFKYCSVGASLDPAIKVETILKLNGE